MGDKKYSVAEAVVNALIAEKVEFVFGLVGSHILPIYNALADVPQIRHINTKHEGNAAFMAGMVGHLTGQPGVVLVTAGPGAVNSLTGVAQAYASSYPMVHISGTVPTGSGNEAFHGVDQADFLRICRPYSPGRLRLQSAADPGLYMSISPWMLSYRRLKRFQRTKSLQL
jgi:acetolactate synthase-1/2/3 large subunit